MTFLNEDDFYSVWVLASCQTPKLEDQSWLTAHDCLFNIFAANSISGGLLPHPQPRGRARPWKIVTIIIIIIIITIIITIIIVIFLFIFILGGLGVT